MFSNSKYILRLTVMASISAAMDSSCDNFGIRNCHAGFRLPVNYKLSSHREGPCLVCVGRRLPICVIGDLGRESLQEEFTQDVVSGVARQRNQSIDNGQLGAATIGGIVEIRERSRCAAA